MSEDSVMDLSEHWLVVNENTGALVAWCDERRARGLLRTYSDVALRMDGPFVPATPRGAVDCALVYERALSEIERALSEIVAADPVDLALDPDWPRRIAAEALKDANADHLRGAVDPDEALRRVRDYCAGMLAALRSEPHAPDLPTLEEALTDIAARAATPRGAVDPEAEHCTCVQTTRDLPPCPAHGPFPTAHYRQLAEAEVASLRNNRGAV
jgi:hypothetical protein